MDALLKINLLIKQSSWSQCRPDSSSLLSALFLCRVVTLVSCKSPPTLGPNLIILSGLLNIILSFIHLKKARC